MSKLSDIIAPSFFSLHGEIKNEKYTHYWLGGGRGSTKSSFVSIEIILGMMKHKDANAAVIRKVGLNLKDSVYEQLIWAIDKLGVSDLWIAKLSPLELVYRPTNQRILFRGADKPKKLKSLKVSKGYIRYIWYEECDEFLGMKEIRTINQSLMRGSGTEGKFDVFYTYNPPQSQRNWVNQEILTKSKDKRVHQSNYLSVPRGWLGEQFLIEAEHLKEVNETAYRHEYLGEVTGTGGEIFTNVKIERISDEEIAGFDRIKRGVDFGYTIDPFVYIVCHFDKKHKRLYIFDEIYKLGLSNVRAAELIKEKGDYSQPIIADAAEPKSIADLRDCGLRTRKAIKNRHTIEYGIKYLQSLEAIVIDNIRCPEAAREFLNYEFEPAPDGGFKDCYPDKNNHVIDAVRYAMDDEISHKKAKVINRDEFF